MRQSKPGEADVEGVGEEHLARRFGLRLALGGQDGVIGAPLNAALFVPSALAVAHEHHPLRPRDRREIRGCGGSAGRSLDALQAAAD